MMLYTIGASSQNSELGKVICKEKLKTANFEHNSQ